MSRTKRPQARLSRRRWIEAALDVMAEGGIQAVRVEPLARALCVTKGSFYWHFKDRSDLLEAIVDHWEKAGTERVIEVIEGSSGSPKERLLRLFHLSRGDDNFAAELALREWARRDEAIGERVRQVDDRRMQYLRKLLRGIGCKPADAERRALLMYSLLIGNHFIAAQHGRWGRDEVLSSALELLFETST